MGVGVLLVRHSLVGIFTDKTPAHIKVNCTCHCLSLLRLLHQLCKLLQQVKMAGNVICCNGRDTTQTTVSVGFKTVQLVIYLFNLEV